MKKLIVLLLFASCNNEAKKSELEQAKHSLDKLIVWTKYSDTLRHVRAECLHVLFQSVRNPNNKAIRAKSDSAGRIVAHYDSLETKAWNNYTTP